MTFYQTRGQNIPLLLRVPDRNPGVYHESSALLGARVTDTTHRLLTCEMQAKSLPQRFFHPQQL